MVVNYQRGNFNKMWWLSIIVYTVGVWSGLLLAGLLSANGNDNQFPPEDH